jgi:prolipoprotein diacylglyceryl transferase
VRGRRPELPLHDDFPGLARRRLALLPSHPEWQSLFDTYGALPRHASQLYELALEGVVLFLILNLFIRKPRPTGSVSGLFLIGYGLFRIIVEFFRQPDAQFTGGWGTVHQHGADSFDPDGACGYHYDGLGVPSSSAATNS